MKKVTENNIEEQVKREIGGGYFLGVLQWYYFGRETLLSRKYAKDVSF